MAPLILEGETLGQKHRSYNKVLKEITSKDPTVEISQINYDEPDIDNLLKIDIASYNKNVEYIIEVLKCEDMFYVSRALKRSVWLINNNEYKHIINPDYIYSNLLPQMTSKAGQKFLLSIRLNLTDQQRVEEFYEYYTNNNQQNLAFKWLSKCSLAFIEAIVDKHANDIPKNIIQRLCKKSFSILEVCIKKMDGYDLSKSLFLLYKEPEKFLNILNTSGPYYLPKFNSKLTNFIMKTCPEVILNDFEKFAYSIDVPTFTKFLKKEEIKNFLMEHNQNKKLKSWFNFENITHFIARIPIEGRFEFVKRVCIDKFREEDTEPRPFETQSECEDEDMVCCAMKSSASRPSNANIYKWYRFAPFSTAFVDLQKLIHTESNSSERNEMFAVLMSCARRNLQNVQTVLQYYRDKHINEPFKFKSHFVNIVLSHSDSHRFNDKTWSILNEIFCSMEVYSENDNNVQSCIKHIILYNVVHNLIVPDNVENKFEFDTLQSFQSKLNKEEKEKVFNYLYQYMITKIKKHQFDSESGLQEAKKDILNILKLLVDWKKDLLDHIFILEKIKELILAKTEKCWNEDLSDIYNIKKSWRKHMFKESLFLRPTKETFANALKHGPGILTIPKENMVFNNKTIPEQLLNKLRIYWNQSLANIFKDHYLSQLSNTTYHSISIQGLCILLPQRQLIDIIKAYKPQETKINWGETDAVALGIQKNIGKYMHFARPQPSVDLVLLYAKGDYLQFSLPSLHSILYNISKNRSLEYIPMLLDAPVSLQKHGLRFASAKLKTDEILNICLTSWKSTKNASIRAATFMLVFDLLCKKQNEASVTEIWNVLSIIIDDLTSEENKNIYATLGEASKVPLAVRQDFCIKSYRFLKSLPPKTNCERYVNSVIDGTMDILEFLSADFVSEIVFDKICGSKYYSKAKLVASYLLSTKSEFEQLHRYERIFIPLILKYSSFINNTEINKNKLKSNFEIVLKYIHKNVQEYVLEKNMITPTKLFYNIYSTLETNFPIEEYYVMILTWKISAEYMKIIEKYRLISDSSQKKELLKTTSDESKWDILFLEAGKEFGYICMQLLNNEIKQYFPGIYRLFSKSLKELFEGLQLSCSVQIKTLQSIQEHADIDEGHLLVLKVLPKYLSKEERSKIFNILGSHPSAEVRMQYQHIRRIVETYRRFPGYLY